MNDFDRICAVGPNHSDQIYCYATSVERVASGMVRPRMSVREPVEDGTIETSACDPRLLAFRSSILNVFSLPLSMGHCVKSQCGVYAG